MNKHGSRYSKFRENRFLSFIEISKFQKKNELVVVEEWGTCDLFIYEYNVICYTYNLSTCFILPFIYNYNIGLNLELFYKEILEVNLLRFFDC